MKPRQLILTLALAGCALVLAGCAKEGPKPWAMLAALKADPPPLPAECTLPPVKEPKLRDEDATDLDAVRHIEALKRAYRTEKGRRLTCKAALDAFYPETPGV